MASLSGFTAGEPASRGTASQYSPQKKVAHTGPEAAGAAGPPGAGERRASADRHRVGVRQSEGQQGSRSFGLLTGWRGKGEAKK